MPEISNEEYSLCQAHLLAIGALVRGMPLDAFLERLAKSDAAAAILDPTLYRAASAHLELVRRMATALQAFKATLPTVQEAHALDTRRHEWLNEKEVPR